MRYECFTDSSHLRCEYALDETFNETWPGAPTVAFSRQERQTKRAKSIVAGSGTALVGAKAKIPALVRQAASIPTPGRLIVGVVKGIGPRGNQ